MSINSGRHANHLARNRLALLAGSYGFDGATLEVAEHSKADAVTTSPSRRRLSSTGAASTWLGLPLLPLNSKRASDYRWAPSATAMVGASVPVLCWMNRSAMACRFHVGMGRKLLHCDWNMAEAGGVCGRRVKILCGVAVVLRHPKSLGPALRMKHRPGRGVWRRRLHSTRCLGDICPHTRFPQA
jgi:hypothetical protein